MSNTIKMKCPEGKIKAVSVGGTQYSSDKNGVFVVPAELERSLLAFGLLTVGVNIPDEVAQPVEPKKPAKSSKA